MRSALSDQPDVPRSGAARAGRVHDVRFVIDLRREVAKGRVVANVVGHQDAALAQLRPQSAVTRRASLATPFVAPKNIHQNIHCKNLDFAGIVKTPLFGCRTTTIAIKNCKKKPFALSKDCKIETID